MMNKTDSRAVAEYLLMAASGISVFWLNQGEGKSYLEIARQMVPMIFRSVTEEEVRARELD